MIRRRACLLWVILVAWYAAPTQVNAEEGLPRSSAKAEEALRLLESADPYQRELGFLRLEALRERSTMPTIKTYLTSQDPEVRAYSVRALAAIEGVEAIPALLHVLGADKNPRVRRAALLGLEPLQRSDPQVLPAFLKALRDHDTSVRMTAVDIVSRIDDPRAREAILTRYKREGRRDVRRVLALAIKRIQH